MKIKFNFLNDKKIKKGKLIKDINFFGNYKVIYDCENGVTGITSVNLIKIST